MSEDSIKSKINFLTEESLIDWHRSGLKIKPLELILNVISELADDQECKDCFLTPDELANVIIPIVLFSQDQKFLAKAILQYRTFPEKFVDLPNCAPGSNDKRMVREHLLLLANYGILKKVDSANRNRFGEKYYLSTIDLENVKDILQTVPGEVPAGVDINKVVPVHYAPATIRTRKFVEVTSRPNQAKFRKALLANFNCKCLISGEVVNDVLVACHVHEVKDGGSDHSDNGVVLRADLHILFDKNKLRISQDGDVLFSPDIAEVSTYHQLPSKVTLPKSVNLDLVRRRFEYGRVVLPDQNEKNQQEFSTADEDF